MVLDARAGRPVSFNREARRIVESLRTPGHPAEQLLEVVSVHRADGREVSLAEMPLVQTLGAGETVRAEEVVLAVPDGRSVRTLINATPIRAEGGGVGSVVVTMQDLAPLDEIERMRTEFRRLIVEQRADPIRAPVHRGHRPVLAVDNASVRLARPHVHTGTTERVHRYTGTPELTWTSVRRS